MKKVLMLGGSYFQVPSIVRAKELGYHVVSCDNVPTNPGHVHAHEYHEVSTTDKEGVLALARSLQVDGVVCYASDPAAPTAAYVCEKMGFPTHPYESVEILCNKDRFRAFLSDNGFHVPKARGFSGLEEAREYLQELRLPAIVKPIDSSGSKGVTRIDDPAQLPEAVLWALQFSRAKRFIVEEFIEADGYPTSGDGFTWEGDLRFRCFLNDHRNRNDINPYVPIGLSMPYAKPPAIHEAMHAELQRALSLLGMRSGSYNFDLRVDKDGKPVIMEIGPRSGGNNIPQITHLATGVDMVTAVIQAAMGEDCSDIRMAEPVRHICAYILHTNVEGTMRGVRFDPEFKRRHVLAFDQIVPDGAHAPLLKGSNGTLGMLTLEFFDNAHMLECMDNMDRWVQVLVSP